jgi:hypothetical protein
MRIQTDKKIKIAPKKLGREKAWGEAYTDTGNIKIDSRIRGKHRLRILCHEVTHIIFPEMSEAKVLVICKILADTLWAQGYRKVDNKIK